MTRLFNVLACAIVGLAVVVALRAWASRDSAGPPANSGVEMVSPAFLVAAGTGPRMGAYDAPVIFLLYSDYRCGACREFDNKVRTVRTRYPEHLAVIIKPFARLDTSEETKMFMAAECAEEQGVFETFHNVAMDMYGQADDRAHWTVVADSTGVPDRAGFDRCVLTARYAAKMERDYLEGVGLGVRVVPTSIINGQVYEGSLGLAALDSAIARAMPRLARPPHPE